MDKATYRKELSKLRKSLRRKYAEVARRTASEKRPQGYSVVSVMRVLNGEWVNPDILSVAKKVSKEVENGEKSFTKLISK